MRILYVEDDITVAEPVELIVRQAGYDLDTANCGEDAVDLAVANDYDLILLDNSLPDMDGYRFIGRMRSAGRRTPFLVQPFDRNELIKEIEKVVGSANPIKLVPQRLASKPAQPQAEADTADDAPASRGPSIGPAPGGPDSRVAAAQTKLDNGDIQGAARDWRGLAEEGIAEAQHSLAILHATGQGVARDYAQSAEWHEAAAEQGHARSQITLAVMYKYGLGVPRDFVCAYTWCHIAAAGLQGDEAREAAIASRDGIARLMTPAQIAEAKVLAEEWWAAHPDP